MCSRHLSNILQRWPICFLADLPLLTRAVSQFMGFVLVYLCLFLLQILGEESYQCCLVHCLRPNSN